MNVCVVGLTHLGTVTAVGLAASGHDVTGLDVDAAVVEQLSAGVAPVYEPGLEDLLRRALSEGRLRFTMDVARALNAAGVVWVAYDTPVDEYDRADVAFVVDRVAALFPLLRPQTLVLISSQVPVGTTRRLEQGFHASHPDTDVSFGYSPENLRLGQALETFLHPTRVVVGVRSAVDQERARALFAPLNSRIEWMSVESAEMTKHALNAFLATSVAFMNEVATLCEGVGADAKEVERGLKSEPRIGPHAYLAPGAAFAGGTLARDLLFLTELGATHDRPALMLSAVRESNQAHRGWARRTLTTLLGTLRGRRVAVWGLAYKPGTESLRRSATVELCHWLAQQGAEVHAHDGAVRALPEGLAHSIRLHRTPLEAIASGAALVIGTAWPEYQALSADQIVSAMETPIVLDPGRYLENTLGADARIQYHAVGRPSASSRPLEGRVAIITGASQGLGLMIARAYVQAGASVVLCARDPHALDAARRDVASLAGPAQRVLAQTADVSDFEDIERLVAGALATFSRVHVLVNNAGVYGPKGSVESVDWDEWVKAVSINLLGSVLMCRALLPHFKAHRYGKIVQLSGGGATSPLPGISAYAASKAAIVRFVETLAEEVREHQIDVNAIAPGALNTRMLDEVLDAGPDAVGRQYYERSQRQKEEGGVPLEIGANLAVFLGSSASDGISGKLISAVWDPWKTLPEHIDELRRSDIYTLRRIVPSDRGQDWGER